MIDGRDISCYRDLVMLRTIDAMPNPNVAPVGPQPEPQPPAGDTSAREGLDRHLQGMLDRFESAATQPESPERSRELENVAGEYAIGSLEAILAAKDGGLVEAQLITNGARTKDGAWKLESPLFTFLAEEMARTLPTRLDGLRRGQYKGGARELNDGIRKHLRTLVRTYTPPRDAREDRRQRPAAAA